jgi:hypothetical protein
MLVVKSQGKKLTVFFITSYIIIGAVYLSYIIITSSRKFGINGIDEIIVISPLDLNNKRYEYIKQNEKATGLKFNYITNVNASAPFVETYKHQHGFNLSSARMALTLSHFKTWEYIVENKLRNTIILEDDVEMERDFKRLTENLIPIIEREKPDILLLGHCTTKLKTANLTIVPIDSLCAAYIAIYLHTKERPSFYVISL